MDMGKIGKIVGSVLGAGVIGALGFCGIWTVRNWDKVYSSMDGSSIYTIDDLKKAEQESYNKAAKNEIEYQKTIAELRDTVTTLQVENVTLTEQVNTLNLSVTSTENEIKKLTNTKQNLESQVANLQSVTSANESTINSLNTQIATLKLQADEVPGLNTQIESLQALASQLQTTNKINSETIISLNSQIISLNNQIRDMSEVSHNTSKQITVLNNRISELQSSISYYESYISTLENNTKAVATYEVDGKVWKIEIVDKGEISLPQYLNNSSLIFNGWTIADNDTMLGNTYTIDSNTKFVADVTHKYLVQFVNNDEVYNTQVVTKNEAVTLPSNPVKNGYEFLGWSLNGVDVINNIDSIEVSEHTTYYAVYAKLHIVTFMSGDQVVSTQTIRNGNYATTPDNNPVKEDYVFDNWTVNGVDTDVSSTQIFLDTVFVAKFHTWEVVCSEDIYCAAFKQIKFPITRNYSDSETLVDINVDVSNKIRVKLKDIKCFEECESTSITIADFLIIESENISSASMVSHLGDIVTIEFSVCSKDGKLLISAKTSRENTGWDLQITSFVIECVEILRL